MAPYIDKHLQARGKRILCLDSGSDQYWMFFAGPEGLERLVRCPIIRPYYFYSPASDGSFTSEGFQVPTTTQLQPPEALIEDRVSDNVVEAARCAELRRTFLEGPVLSWLETVFGHDQTLQSVYFMVCQSSAVPDDKVRNQLFFSELPQPSLGTNDDSILFLHPDKVNLSGRSQSKLIDRKWRRENLEPLPWANISYSVTLFASMCEGHPLGYPWGVYSHRPVALFQRSGSGSVELAQLAEPLRPKLEGVMPKEFAGTEGYLQNLESFARHGFAGLESRGHNM